MSSKCMPSHFLSTRFVLVMPSHAGNVGAAARAIKAMGFSRLVLVNPRDQKVLNRKETIALASGATDILNQAIVTQDLKEALIGTHLTVALTARTREISAPHQALAQTLTDVTAKIAKAGQMEIAFVFGNERNGLSNTDIKHCQAISYIPTHKTKYTPNHIKLCEYQNNEAGSNEINKSNNINQSQSVINPLLHKEIATFSSLNLAQAIQITAYEWRMRLLTQQESQQESEQNKLLGPMASSDEIENMLAHFEKALINIEFLNPNQSKKLMPKLRRFFAKAELEKEEVNIFRGIAKNILKIKSKIQV